MGSVRGTDRADENGTSEQESGGLADGAGVRRITDFRRGVGQVSTWSQCGGAEALTGQESAEPLTELVSADPFTARGGPRVGLTADEGQCQLSCRLWKTGVGQDAHKEPETSVS